MQFYKHPSFSSILIKVALILVFYLFSKQVQAQNNYQLQPTPIDSLGVKDLIHKAKLANSRDSSRQLYLTALEGAKQLNYTPGITEILPLLVELEKNTGEISSALRYALEALRFFTKIDDRLNIYNSLINLAEIYQEENLPEKAIEHYQQAIRIVGNQIPKDVLAALQMNIALNYSNNIQADSASHYYLKAKSYYDKEQDTLGVIKCLQQISRFHAKFENHTEAIHYNMALISLMKLTNDRGQQAVIYNNVGYNYHELEDYKNAINYFELAASLSKDNKVIDLPGLYINMAIAYSNLGNQNKSNQYFNKALEIIPSKDVVQQGEVEHLLANNYLNQGDIYNALRFNETTIELARQAHADLLLSRAYFTAARIQEKLYDYEIALEFYQKHLQLRDSFRLEERLKQQRLLQQRQLLERAEREISLLLINQEVQQLTIEQLQLAEEKKTLEVKQLELDNKAKEDELKLAAQEKEVQAALIKNKELEAERTRQQLAFSQQELLAIQRAQEISILKQKEQEQQLELQQNEAEEQQRLADISRLEREQEVAQLELKREADFRQFVYGLGGLTVLILFLILAGLLYFRKASQMLSQQNQQIELQKGELEQERNISEQLLLNILPQQTAHELKTKGKSTPRQYDMVSVIFTDFRNFTSLASNLGPEELIETLNTYFKAFDQILEKHALEKIKTIGDAYMCVAGLPTPHEDHAIRAVNAALEMQQYVQDHQPNNTQDESQQWRMRLGIHSGPVVAGVVGTKKFAYDVWGDTVNVASRMESGGEAGRVNVSETTYHMIKHSFNCEFRGEIVVKGKGEIGMYFVEKLLS